MTQLRFGGVGSEGESGDYSKIVQPSSSYPPLHQAKELQQEAPQQFQDSSTPATCSYGGSLGAQTLKNTNMQEYVRKKSALTFRHRTTLLFRGKQ